jgi:uncharacterized protein (TIGR02271 family)
MKQFSANTNTAGSPSPLLQARLFDAAGHEASIVGVDNADADAQARIQYADGLQVLIPVSLLTEGADGSYHLPFAFNTPSTFADDAQIAIPVIQEEARVDKRIIDTGSGIRLHKTVSSREQLIDVPLLREELAVEHVPVGRVVDENDVPQSRYEGDMLVIPVLEEVLVVQKQLVLKEELRITRNRREIHEPQTVRLRSEQVGVEQFQDGKH